MLSEKLVHPYGSESTVLRRQLGRESVRCYGREQAGPISLFGVHLRQNLCYDTAQCGKLQVVSIPFQILKG